MKSFLQAVYSLHSQSPLTAIESNRAFVTTARVEEMFMLNIKLNNWELSKIAYLPPIATVAASIQTLFGIFFRFFYFRMIPLIKFCCLITTFLITKLFLFYHFKSKKKLLWLSTLKINYFWTIYELSIILFYAIDPHILIRIDIYLYHIDRCVHRSDQNFKKFPKRKSERLVTWLDGSR